VEIKAEQTVKRIMKGMEDGQCACLPEMLRMIHNLSAKFHDLAIQELADLIKNDTIVLQKVVSAANTIGYNPSGADINSVGEAIQVIGFNRVRSLTMSLILLENANMWQFSEERREATLASLTSGILAQELAQSSESAEPELAFLCGALRGFGRIVLATYMIDEFRGAEDLAPELTADRAYREVFGLTPIELGYHLMEASHMSPVLLKTLQGYNPARYRETILSAEDRLLGIADYAYQLAQVSLDPAVSGADYGKTIDVLNDRYKTVIKVPEGRLEDVLKETDHKLKALIASSGRDSFPRRALACLQYRIEKVDPPPPPARETAAGSTSKTPDETEAESARARHWEDGIDRLRASSSEGKALKGPVLDDILRTVRQGLQADESWIFLRVPGKKGFHFRGGNGAHSLVLENRAAIGARESSIFGLCLKRKESIFISEARDPKIRPHLPPWFLQNVQLNSFVLLCLHHKTAVVGLIFAGWRASGEVEIPPGQARLIHRLLAVVSQMH